LRTIRPETQRAKRLLPAGAHDHPRLLIARHTHSDALAIATAAKP